MDFYCLACGYSRGGICIAGISSTGWVRPVRASGFGWPEELLRNVGLLGRDVLQVSLPQGTPTPVDRYVEDVLLKDTDIQHLQVNSLAATARSELLATSVEPLSRFRRDRSAGLLRVRSILITQSGENQYGYRYIAEVSDGFVSEISRVTLPWLLVWLNENVGAGTIRHTDLSAQLGEEIGYAALTWGKPFNGRAYSFLVGLFPL